MKKLNPRSLESSFGGRLSSSEIEDFLGAASCASLLFTGGAALLFTGFSCIYWLVR